MEELRKKAFASLKDDLLTLRDHFSEKGYIDDSEYYLLTGKAWGYVDIGLITFDEAYNYVTLFAKACGGQ